MYAMKAELLLLEDDEEELLEDDELELIRALYITVYVFKFIEITFWITLTMSRTSTAVA